MNEGIVSIRTRGRSPLRALALIAAAIAAFAAATCSHEQINGDGRAAIPKGDAAPARPEAARWKEAKGTALVIIDMQNGYMPILRQQPVFQNISALIEAADAASAPVIWVYTDDDASRQGSSAFEITPPLAPAEKHLKVMKTGSSAFMGTDLAAILEERKIGRLVFCGLASNFCVRATVEAAMGAGYRTVVAEDAHSVVSGYGSSATIDGMNDLWRADDRIELMPTAAIGFAQPSVARLGLGEADWPHSPGFSAFLDDSYKALLARSPETATQMGLSAWAGLDDTGLDGLSEEYAAETLRIEKRALAALDAYDRATMTEGDRLSADAYKRYLTDAIAVNEFADMDYVVNPTVFGVAYAAESLFTSIHPLATLGNARSYVARLEALGAKIDDAAAALRRREANNAIAPRLILENALPDISAIAHSEARRTMFYATLESGLSSMQSIEAADRGELLSKAERVIAGGIIPAYGRLAEEVGRQIGKAPDEIGLWKIPGGSKYYAALLRAKTTTSLTPDEIHELGLRELKRIHAEIAAADGSAGEPAAVVASAFSSANNIGPAQALDGYTARLRATEQAVRPYFPLYPSAPVEIRTAPQGGYYQPGPIDGSRPGVFYAAKGAGANKAGMPTLLYHETVPGHHLQQSIAHELKLPVARKLLFFEAYVEGWALYAERLMADIGAYSDDPAGNIGRLQAEAFRAARLVVDTGIHAKRWSFQKAVDFMVTQGFLPPRVAQGEVIRYASIPGQATAYYVGFLKFLELRERAHAQLGEDFDLGAFHRTVLSCGALPFDELSYVVDRYIAEAKAER